MVRPIPPMVGLTLGLDGTIGRDRARAREGVPFWHNPEGLAPL